MSTTGDWARYFIHFILNPHSHLAIIKHILQKRKQRLKEIVCNSCFKKWLEGTGEMDSPGVKGLVFNKWKLQPPIKNHLSTRDTWTFNKNSRSFHQHFSKELRLSFIATTHKYTHIFTQTLTHSLNVCLPLPRDLAVFSWLGRIPAGTDLLRYPQNGGRKSSSPEMRAEQHLGGPCSWCTVSGVHWGQHRDTLRPEQRHQTQSCNSQGLQHQAQDRGRHPR